MRLEVCVENLPSALAAERAGASRLELCQNLSLGGTTPSYGLLRSVLQNVKIPVCVLIRPRTGDFVFGEDEWRIMAADIAVAEKEGASAIVVGALTRTGELDLEALRYLRRSFPQLPFVFHRAIDFCPEPFQAIAQLAELGFQRILSSGAQKAVRDGLPLLRRMNERASGRLEIVPGGGIRPADKGLLRGEDWIRSLHLSATVPDPQPSSELAPGMSGGPRRVDEAWIRDWSLS